MATQPDKLPDNATLPEVIAYVNATSHGLIIMDKKAYVQIGNSTYELGKKVELNLPEEASTGGVVTAPPVVSEPVVEDPFVPIADLSQVMIPADKDGSLLVKVQAGGLFNVSIFGNSKKNQYGKYFSLGKPKGKKLFVKDEKRPARQEELVQSTGAFELQINVSETKISFRKGDELMMEADRAAGIDTCFRDVSMTGASVEGKGVVSWL